MSRSFINVFKKLTIDEHRDPMPVPEKGRKPLTEIQAFDLHVEHRAVGRADFDQKVRFTVTSTIKNMLYITS